MTKILIIRFSSIGDIVLTTPVIRQLKQQLDGEVRIDFLTKSTFSPILESNPYVEKVWKFDGENLDEVINRLKEEEFDYVVDLHKNIRSAKVKNRLKQMTFSFEKHNWEKWLLVNFGVDKLPDVHIVDRYLDSCKPFGLKDDGQGLDYFIPDAERLNLTSIGPDLESYLVWVVGAAHEGKRFSEEKTICILNKVEQKVILIGGSGEEEIAGRIDAATGNNIINLCGQLSIHGSASVIEKARLVVTPDTGMMHIAAALKKNIISLWGCTVPKLGMYPYRPGEKSVMLEPIGLNKRPCSKLGDRCKYKGYCINQIEDNLVLCEIGSAMRE